MSKETLDVPRSGFVSGWLHLHDGEENWNRVSLANPVYINILLPEWWAWVIKRPPAQN